jgi:hypothetical protein
MADASIWFDFLNTHAPDAAYAFYDQAGLRWSRTNRG